jgi:hypothetical protein
MASSIPYAIVYILAESMARVGVELFGRHSEFWFLLTAFWGLLRSHFGEKTRSDSNMLVVYVYFRCQKHSIGSLY